ncbi:DUF4112 domain-containing protein [Hugenholtzia roseola]|uniref:DUF4112 domain-containing protein n=1 Tax=Hugenholtzia roseola TaxID=1002 RepID=UPI0003FE1BC7|nr:DUF4112 domain-containing protein [Hugenholtzia roseola]
MKPQNNLSKNPQQATLPAELRWIERSSQILDEAFGIPATNVRFGLDPLIGMIPMVGDLLSFAISASMLIAVVRHGVSLSVLFKMLGNILVDYLVGLLPFLGDFFDFAFKANKRNLTLLQRYYATSHKESNKIVLWLVLLVFIIGMLALIGGVFFLIWGGIKSQIQNIS